MTSGTGTCSVKYDQAGDANYNAAPQVTETVNAQKADQTINVTTHAPASAVYNTSFAVAATAPGGAVSFSSSGACTNTGATFTITSGTGTCTVKYDQAGNAQLQRRPAGDRVGQRAEGEPDDHRHAPRAGERRLQHELLGRGDGGGSGNPVTFSSSGVCTNTGATFTMTSGTGTCTVKYDQAGDANYNAAPQVTESVTAQKASQTITFAPLPDRTYGDPDFTVSATASSGLAVSFGATGQCTVTGATVHLTGPGSCTITASQGGDANYAAATDVSRTFQISAPAESVGGDDRRRCHLRAVRSGDGAGALDRQLHRQEGRHQQGHPEPGRLLGQGHRAGRAAHGGGRPGDHVGQLQSEADPRHRRQGLHRRVREGEGRRRSRAAPDGSVTVGFNATAAGTYLIAVRYHSNAVNGQATPAPTTIHYLFSTAGVSSSTATLDFLRQAPAHPASSLRSAAFLRLLRR